MKLHRVKTPTLKPAYIAALLPTGVAINYARFPAPKHAGCAPVPGLRRNLAGDFHRMSVGWALV